MSEHTSKDAAAPSPASQAQGLALSVWEHVRQGATHFPLRSVPPPQHPVRQFIHGLSLPFHLARALRSDARAWRRYLWVGIVQSLVILTLGFMFTRSANEAVELAQEQAPQSATRAEAAEEVAKDELKRFKREVKLAAEETARGARELRASLAPLAGGAEPTPEPTAVEPRPALEEAPAKGAPRVTTKLVIEDLQFWAALFATLQIVQWVVIALSRDYHDAISRDASLLTAIEPEDEPLTPRVRLDVAWMGKKLSRRVRAFLVFLAGMPAFFMLTAPFYFASGGLLTVLVTLWSVYWLVVFTTSKSALAWEDTSGREPFFLRAWSWLTTRVPGLRWGFLQAYGRFWANRSRAVFSPAVELEKQPWAFAGLAVIRALAILPVVKCFLRPLIPVAAAHLILAQRAVASTTASEQSALPSQPAASSSASAT